MNHLPLLVLGLVMATVAIVGCVASDPAEPSPASEKIKFRLDNIRPDGLRGPADGLTSVAYEFCVPGDDQVQAEIRRLDPSVEMHLGSPGRVGCKPGQASASATRTNPTGGRCSSRLPRSTTW